VVLVVVLVLPFAIYEKRAVDQQGAAPEAAVRAYCQAEVEQRSVDAWGLLSDDEQANWDAQPGTFVQANQSADSKYGPVTSCRVLGRDFANGFGPDNAAFTVEVTRASGGTHQATVVLHPYGFDRRWVLDDIPPELDLPS
jgi:hypothetical protein